MSTEKKDILNRFWIKIAVFILILLILDRGVGSLLQYYYFRQNSGLLYRTTYSLDSTKAKILVFGSSTANHHYIPADFEKELGLSTYNTGRDGNSIFYHLAVLKSVLKRYTPKIVIFDFNEEDFKKDQANYDRLSSLLPYYYNHPELRSIILLKSPYEKYKMISKIYPFNSLLFTIGAGISDFNKSRDDVKDENGYVPLYKTWNGPLYNDTTQAKYEIDSNIIESYKSFIKHCANSDIKLYVFVSPSFVKHKYKDKSIDIAERIAYTYNVPFFDFTNDSTFISNKDYYADAYHLNEKGAEIFTQLAINCIIKQQKNGGVNRLNDMVQNQYFSKP